MLAAIRRLKTIGKIVAGKEFLARCDIACESERLGSSYGGWNAVITNLNSDSVVYSFGVGEDASFDTALIERYGLTVHAFDPTPKSIEWVKRQGFSDRFVMHDHGIAAFDGIVSLYPPEDPTHVSHSTLERALARKDALKVPVRRLCTIMKELGHDHVDILKMDIEGAEYSVIDDIAASGIRPQQMLVEFHHRFPNVGIEMSKIAIERLRAMGYKLFSVSATNEEFCFIRSPSVGSPVKDSVQK